MTIAIRTAGDPRDRRHRRSRRLHDLDPNVAAADVQTMEEVIDNSVAQRRLTMLLLSIFAGLALVLAAVGHLRRDRLLRVTQRTQEIGIRMALGAPRPTSCAWSSAAPCSPWPASSSEPSARGC